MNINTEFMSKRLLQMKKSFNFAPIYWDCKVEWSKFRKNLSLFFQS